MGRPIRITGDSVWNAGTSLTGFSNLGGFNAAALVSRPTPDRTTTANYVTWTGTAANTAGFALFPAPGATLTKRGISLWVYADLTGLTPHLGSTSTGYIRFRTASGTDQFEGKITLRHGWNHIQMGWADFTVAAGSPNWNTSTWVDMLMKIDAKSGVTHSISVADIGWLGKNRSLISFRMDDGLNTVRTVMKPLLDQYGWVGTVGVISSMVGVVTGKMTAAQLHALHDAGWGMANHSNLHSPSPFILSHTVQQLIDEIMTCQNYLAGQGFTRDGEHLDYWSPYGESTANLLTAAATCCRSVGGVYGDTGLASNPSWSSSGGVLDWPIPSLYLESTTNMTTAKAAVKQAVLTGRPLPIIIHTTDATADNVNAALEVTSAKFADLLADMYKYSALFDVVTYAQMIQAVSSPTT